MTDLGIQEPDSQTEGEETLSYPVWVLRKAQEAAWAQGHARLNAKQMRQIRRIQNDRTFRTAPARTGGNRNIDFTVDSTDNSVNSVVGKDTTAVNNGNADRKTNVLGGRLSNVDGLTNWQDISGPRDQYARQKIADLNLLQPSPGLANYGRSGRKTRRDPSKMTGVLQRLFKSQGLESFLDEGRLRANWETLVGPAVAQHTKIERIQGGQVTIRCDSTRWATQLRLMIPQIMKILDDQAGSLAIESLLIKGPEAPSWKRGKRSVPGPGPRDTYG